MIDYHELLKEAEAGFKTLTVSEKYQQQALLFLKHWLTDNQFLEYQPQIQHLIENKYWDYLLDSFYQVIPFGTGGRRGEVGIGPNRINPWTVNSAAQGHAQYLIRHYGDEAKQRGVVTAYDVREFFGNKYFSEDLPNPVKNLTCKSLAESSVSVYTANGLKVYIFDSFRSTPELSFAIRFLNSVGGAMISASHNPPEHNGQKVFDEFGGQLIPPYDERLVQEVVEHVSKIERIELSEAEERKLLITIGREVDEAYMKAVKKVSLSDERDIKIVYTPLHGTGLTNAYAALESVGFHPEKDPKTSFQSGKFENVTFNIPNPEVEQSFDTSLKYAKEVKADILLASDPDSDRIGIMVHHKGEWVFLNGNELAAILAEYAISRIKPNLKGKGVIIKTAVTTDLIREICHQNDVDIIGDLLVGYKYVAEEMNKLEKQGRIEEFIMGCEESHGYNTGNFAREKDSAPAAVWLSELAAILKTQGKTLVNYLQDIYAKYGYFRNYLTEIRLPGAEGRAQIDKIQEALRNNPPELFGRFRLRRIEDYLNHKPIVSQTDAGSKNMITFYLEPVTGTISLKVTIRPSGTEPKSKMYFEIGSEPFDPKDFQRVKQLIEIIRQELERDFMQECYKIIGVDFPDRGFLLFWQLPLSSKLRYFEIEPEIIALKNISNKEERLNKLEELLAFLGSDPIEKIDKAFQAKYKKPLREYLDY